ncbi:hypothetical protein [Actinoallomurus soli]|uniref:hypothetical protein n=1 Tax=Actinoallomurus soli TaxID=2952535 RepID=UPI0020936704|nr:hypothetical protein [Actinoallomurus soli]MCO5968807.1 hypothetical protein [Actinoallomurus soli]
MDIQLPSYLLPIELFLGKPLNNGKVDDCHRMGDDCEQYAATNKGILAEGQDHKARAVATGQGDDIAAFHQKFEDPQGAHRNLVDASTGTHVMGTGLKVAGNIILAHKGVTLFQYGLTAAALAEAALTGGFGAMAAPMIRQAANKAIDYATNQAAYQVLG